MEKAVDNIYETIGLCVRRQREFLFMTATKLAKLSGISLSYVSRIESGKKKPSIEILLKICEPLQIELGSLITEASLAQKEGAEK